MQADTNGQVTPIATASAENPRTPQPTLPSSLSTMPILATHMEPDLTLNTHVQRRSVRISRPLTLSLISSELEYGFFEDAPQNKQDSETDGAHNDVSEL
jgi:hypothetical protein